MNIIKKLFSTLKEKAVSSGGFEILQKLTSSEFNRKNYLEQYGKSLYVTACISKIAEKVASTDWELYQVLNSKGDTKEIEYHPILDLLYKPNPFQTKTEFLETTIINLKCTGDAYWYKVRNKSGRVVELWSLRPDLMEIIPDPTNFIKEYKLNRTDGTEVTFEPSEIIHFKYPNPLNQFFGLSPIQSAQGRVQTEYNASEYQKNFFLNSARPDAVVKNKSATLTPDQKEDLREGWSKRHQGVRNSSKLAILSGDLEYQQISLSQREMDFIESMKFTRDDILVAFKVPKPIVAIVDDVNRANSETAMYIFLSETIKPEVARICEKINEELIIPDFGKEYFLDYEDPTPENRELELKEYQEGLASNYLLINEVRAREGLEPINGGWSMYLPFTVQAMGGLSQSGKSAKSIVKAIDSGITSIKKAEKKYDFKKNYWLKQAFMIKEEIQKNIEKINFGKPKKKSAKGAIKKTSYLTDPVIRSAFYVKTNQKIDSNTGQLKNDMDEFAKKQESRVLAKLAKQKGKIAEKKKITVSSIINEEKEIALTSAFILPYIENYAKESGLEALLMLAPQEDFTMSKKLQQIIKERADNFANEVTATTIGKLDATLAEGLAEGEGIIQLSDRVNEVYDEFSTYRSDMIARTEATYANAKGAIEGYRQSGVANAKEWINSGDTRVRDEHLDGIGVGGEIVGLDDNFSNGLSEPGEPNCRCVAGPAFIE